MTNFLYAQAPNRKGNESKHPAKHESVGGGVKMATPKGCLLYTSDAADE